MMPELPLATPLEPVNVIDDSGLVLAEMAGGDVAEYPHGIESAYALAPTTSNAARAAANDTNDFFISGILSMSAKEGPEQTSGGRYLSAFAWCLSWCSSKRHAR